MKNLMRFVILSLTTNYLSTEKSSLHLKPEILSYYENIVYRELWGAPWLSDKIPRFTSNIGLPCVIIHDTGSPACSLTTDCKNNVYLIRSLQMKYYNMTDISYNFLIGFDGKIYEGRGWYTKPESIDEFSDQCISIGAIGNFDNDYPNSSILRALNQVLDFGLVIGYLHRNYSIVTHRQFVFPTVIDTIYPGNCPGVKMYRAIQSIPRWINSIITKDYDFYEALNREF